MFAYCGNNPVNFLDFAGTSEEPIWEKMGFEYDGSMRDFKRLNQGLPPYAFEKWLATGGTMETNYHKDLGHGVTQSIESITYVPADKTKDFYITKAKENLEPNVMDDFSFWAGTAMLFVKSCPTLVTVGLYAIDVINKINEKSSQLDISAYEEAMNGGTGILIINWSIGGPRCVGSRYTTYYSWNGSGSFE